jgi:dolichol-phosphate mannosyltransferase
MISVVLPVYNEESILDVLYSRLTAAAGAWNDDYEVIVVNDGSQDGSAEKLASIHRRDHRWKVLSFSRNFGHQTAISAGIHYAVGDAIVVMDADLQDPPEELHRFLAKWRQGYQVVFAIRTRRKESLFKRWAYAAFYQVIRRIASIDLPLDAGDFCVMDRVVADVLCDQPERTRFVRGLRSWAGFRQIGVPYEREARWAGQPKYTLAKLTRLALDGILCFSSVPLRAAAWLGMTLCAAAVLLAILVIIWWASDLRLLGMHPRDVAGWTSLCSLILFVSGLQLLVLGVIGEYIARIFDEVKGREPWIIADALGFETETRELRIGWHVERSAKPRQPSAKPRLRAG